GTDVSIITYGAVVHRAEVAAAQLEREGVSVEIIDLRSLSPFDWEAISATVRKTNRVIVAHEDMLSWGYGAEIAARISDQLFEELDAPVRRVAAMDTFCAYQPKLEDEILPQSNDLAAAVRELLAYWRAVFSSAGVPPAPCLCLVNCRQDAGATNSVRELAESVRHYNPKGCCPISSDCRSIEFSLQSESSAGRFLVA